MATSAPRSTNADPVKRVKSNANDPSSDSMEKATKVTSNVTRTGEYGFPNGHLGFLTPEQETALSDFKELLLRQGLYTAGANDKSPSQSDATLLRFLRARRFVPNDAVTQFKDTEQWRKVNELDNLYLNIDVEDFDESRRHYPQWLGRRDKRGMPVYLFRVGALDSKAMSTYVKNSAEIKMAKPEGQSADQKKADKNDKEKTAPRLLRLFAIYENLAGFMLNLCTALSDRPHPEAPITQTNNIVDISGVGLRQFWNLRSHMQDASVLATAHYPETLDRIFIVGAPSFFPTVWSWVKRWFDPITVSKMFILSEATVFPTLSQFIAPENIPTQYGGSLVFEYGDMATIDPSYADRLTWKDDGASGVKNAKGELRRWPKGSVRWIERDDGDMDLFAVGSIDGKQRRELLATLKLDHPRGGWADKSIPHPDKENDTSNSALTSEKGTTGLEDVTNGQTRSSTQVENPEGKGGNVTPQSSANTDGRSNNIVVPVAAATGTTLVPMVVPGAKADEIGTQTTDVATKLTATAPDLPPSASIGESVDPVPLAAVAEPLPVEEVKTV